MRTVTARRPALTALLPRTVRLLALFGLVAMALQGVPAAWAGNNYGTGDCQFAYNFADERSGYLYASTERFGSCEHASVEIYNKGTLGGIGYPIQFEGSYCSGQQLLAANWGYYDFVATSATLPASQWDSPCSHHEAKAIMGWPQSRGGLYFHCLIIACVN